MSNCRAILDIVDREMKVFGIERSDYGIIRENKHRVIRCHRGGRGFNIPIPSKISKRRAMQNFEHQLRRRLREIVAERVA